MNIIKHKYAINFDLHTDKDSEAELRLNVGISLSKMYDIIERHLLNNGFEWVQGSGYITKTSVASSELSKVIRKLYRDNDWLGYFTRDIKRTIVDDDTYSYDSMLKYYKGKYNEKHKNKFAKATEDIMNSDIEDTLEADCARIVKGMKQNIDLSQNNDTIDIGKENGNENEGM